MAKYAPLGNAIYGETVFGAPPAVTNLTTLNIVPFGYDTLRLNWLPPSNATTWNQQVLVRSAYGTPSSVTDGVQLLNETSSYSAQYIDNDLSSNRFYYYALFVFDTVIDQFVTAASSQALVIGNYFFGNLFRSWIPEWYLAQDQNLATASQPNGPLYRFLSLLGYETDWIRTEIESLFTLNNSELISGVLLPYLGANYGMQYEYQLGMTRSRVLVQNAVHLYKGRGTADGIAAAASAYTGFGTTYNGEPTIAYSPNLMIQLDDAAFDQSAGHWSQALPFSSINIVPTSTYSATDFVFLSQHETYDPAVYATEEAGFVSQGYLPVSNHNVAVITAGTESGTGAWLATNSTVNPSQRIGAQMSTSYDNQHILMFGGAGAYGWVGDTWQWSGINWKNVTPTSGNPPSRWQGGMALLTGGTYSNQPILFGGQGIRYTFYNDMWRWDGSQWHVVTQNPDPTTGFPSPRFRFGFAHSDSLIFVYGGEDATGVLNDFWAFDTTTLTWTEISNDPSYPVPPNNPGIRVGCSLFYDASQGVVFLFGGADGVATFNDMWAYDLASPDVWTEVTPTYPSPTPPTRWIAASTYDPAFKLDGVTTPGTLIFGGSTGISNVSQYNDTWFFNAADATWTEIPSSQVAAIDDSPSMAYDPSTQSVLLWVAGSSSNMTETWLLGFEAITTTLGLATCNQTNAVTLGFPIYGVPLDLEQATPFEPSTTYTASAYFQRPPTSSASFVQFYLQLDWYGKNGVYLSSNTGSAVTEGNGVWIRASVSAIPPFGAYTFGVSVYSTSELTGEPHLMDAVQVEANTTATAWEPPRDIRVNLLPIRQNLVVDPVGLGGGYNWHATNGNLNEVSTSLNWPNDITNGFLATDTGSGISFYTTCVVNGGENYTFSCYALPASVFRTIGIEIGFFDANNVALSTFNNVFSETSAETFSRGGVVATNTPVSAVKAVLSVTVLSAVSSEQHYFTGFMFEPAAFINPYFDANFAPSNDYYFEGTPNQSVSDNYPMLSNKVIRLIEILPDYTPIGATFSIFIGAKAWQNLGLYTGSSEVGPILPYGDGDYGSFGYGGYEA